MYQGLINVLKELKKKRIIENLEVRDLTNDYINLKKYILQAMEFDEAHTCFDNSYVDSNGYILLALLNVTYGLFYNGELIGLNTIGNCNYDNSGKVKDIAQVINKEYRGIGIGSYFLNQVLELYKSKYDFSSIHTAARIDNIPSQKTLESYGFIRYDGYEQDKYFIDTDNNKIEQIQYILKK